MTRRTAHPVARPSTGATTLAERHAAHGGTPFFACPQCIRRAPFKGLDVRWTAPRAI